MLSRVINFIQLKKNAETGEQRDNRNVVLRLLSFYFINEFAGEVYDGSEIL